ncbi:PEP-CTERM sorting domain-containing protein [Roseiconus nitratireducens]|nr:PEP-CTERM sorting domain-containing protein [Roseiconus nitratireducens]
MKNWILGLSVAMTLAVATSASAMSVTVGSTTETADAFGFISFDFSGVTPTTSDSGVLMLTSSSPQTPFASTGEVAFSAPFAMGTLDPPGDMSAPFTYVFDIVSGLAAASADGLIEINGIAAGGVSYQAVIMVESPVTAVPEPGTLSMIALGGLVGGCGLVRRRRR